MARVMASGVVVTDDPIPLVVTGSDVVTMWTALSFARDRWASDVPATCDAAEHAAVGAEIMSALQVLHRPMVELGANPEALKRIGGA